MWSTHHTNGTNGHRRYPIKQGAMEARICRCTAFACAMLYRGHPQKPRYNWSHAAIFAGPPRPRSIGCGSIQGETDRWDRRNGTSGAAGVQREVPPRDSPSCGARLDAWRRPNHDDAAFVWGTIELSTGLINCVGAHHNSVTIPDQRVFPRSACVENYYWPVDNSVTKTFLVKSAALLLQAARKIPAPKSLTLTCFCTNSSVFARAILV